jgi:hypothetical protein
VPAQLVALGHGRVVEVLGGIAGHAEPVHDGPRRRVPGGRERDDLVDGQLLEGERD